MGGPAPHGWLVPTGRVLLAASALLAAFYFFSRWGINAAALGAHDAGTALFLSFASPLSLYASVALSALDAALLALAVLCGRAWLVPLCALLAALLPLAFLVLLHVSGR